jgi:hypothetical protein
MIRRKSQKAPAGTSNWEGISVEIQYTWAQLSRSVGH